MMILCMKLCFGKAICKNLSDNIINKRDILHFFPEFGIVVQTGKLSSDNFKTMMIKKKQIPFPLVVSSL